MSLRGASSQGNSTQSVLAKDICIVVATDDLTWHNIILTMLPTISSKGSWSVLHAGKADDVLNAMCERKEHVGAVFTNVHRLSSKGFDIIQNIKSRLNLPPFLMSPDDENVAISEKGSIFVAYIVNSLTMNDIIKMWQSTVETFKEEQGGKQTASEKTECNTRTSSIDEVTLEEDEEPVGGREDGPLEKKQRVNKTSIIEVTRLKCQRGIEESLEEDDELRGGREDGPSERKQRVRVTSIDEVPWVHCKRDREEYSDDESEEEDDGREHGRGEKKPRMVWTREMHQKFVEAIEILGHEKAVPKKIVEVMEVPGLTRENVASHLQKYRMCIKRAQESDPTSLHGMNHTTAVQNPCYPSGVSHFLSKFPYGNSYLRRNVYGAYAQPPSRRTFPNPFYPSATMYPRSCQMDIRNSQRINGNGLMNTQYGYSPNMMLKSNFRVYNDPKKNVLMNIGGRSVLDANRPSLSDPCTSFLGFRLTGDGKSVEVGGQCIATSIKTTGRETLLQPLANGNTNQLMSTLNESQTSFLSIEDYGYNEGNLIQPPPPMSENCPLGQEHFSEQSSILENELINLYSQTLPENEYSNKYCSSPLDSIPQQQSFLPIYQAPAGISPASSSTPDGTSSQQQVFMPHCHSSGDTLAAQCSMPMDPILPQLASASLFEFHGNESSAQSTTISGSFIQHQYSVAPVPTSSNVGTFQYTATPTTEESPLPASPSHLDELDSILSGIGDDFWNSDIDDIINTINS